MPKQSLLTILTTPPIAIHVAGSNFEIADSETVFADNIIITVPETIEIDLAHDDDVKGYENV